MNAAATCALGSLARSHPLRAEPLLEPLITMHPRHPVLQEPAATSAKADITSLAVRSASACLRPLATSRASASCRLPSVTLQALDSRASIRPPGLHSITGSTPSGGAARKPGVGWRLTASRARRGGRQRVAVAQAAGAPRQALQGHRPVALAPAARSAQPAYGKWEVMAVSAEGGGPRPPPHHLAATIRAGIPIIASASGQARKAGACARSHTPHLHPTVRSCCSSPRRGHCAEARRSTHGQTSRHP